MRRAIPLLKMFGRMVAAGIILTAGHWLATKILLASSANGSMPDVLSDVVVTGIIAGILLWIPMALTTLVFFREIERSVFYRFSMVTVSLVVISILWGPVTDYYRESLFSPGRDSWRLIQFALSFAYYVLLIYCSGLAAQAYSREFHARKLTRQNAKANLDHTKR